MVYLLWRGRRGMGHAAEFDAVFVVRARRILMASLAMGFCLFVSAWLLQDALAAAEWRYLALSVLILIGAITYFGIGQAIGALNLPEMRRMMRR